MGADSRRRGSARQGALLLLHILSSQNWQLWGYAVAFLIPVDRTLLLFRLVLGVP